MKKDLMHSMAENRKDIVYLRKAYLLTSTKTTHTPLSALEATNIGFCKGSIRPTVFTVATYMGKAPCPFPGIATGGASARPPLSERDQQIRLSFLI